MFSQDVSTFNAYDVMALAPETCSMSCSYAIHDANPTVCLKTPR